MLLEQELITLLDSDKKTDAILLLHQREGISLSEAEIRINSLIMQKLPEQISQINPPLNENNNVGKVLIIVIMLLIGVLFLWKFSFKTDSRPTDQQNFENNFAELKIKSGFSNANELQRDEANKEMETLIEKNGSVHLWEGVIASVEHTVLNGDAVIINSQDKHGKLYASYLLKDVKNTPLENLKIGNKVSFSGDFGGSDITTLNGFISAIFSNNRIMVQNASIQQ